MKAMVISIAKKHFFLKNPITENKKKQKQNKMSFFSSTNSQYFFMKILGIGTWVSWINSCKGHRCASTYIVVRLSNVSSKKV